MTLRGVIVCLFELFLVILALGTEINEFFYVAICVAGLLAFSLFSLIIASLTLRVDSKINKKSAIREDKIEYTLYLYGVALIPVVAYLALKTTELEFQHKSRKRYSFVLLPSFSFEHKFAFEIPTVHVGRWDIGIKKMRFEDVFGLFSFPLIRLGKRDFAVDLAVMPKIHNLHKMQEALSSGVFGSTSLKSAETGDLLGDSRLYKEGDSLKRINWKLSARTRTMYSRQYEVPQKPKVVIVVDNAVSNGTVSDMADIICETAISLSNFFLSHNNMVDIISVREKADSENKLHKLRGYSDIHKMQYAFSYLKFYKNDVPLRLDMFEEFNISKADRLYVVSTNPAVEMLSDFVDINKGDKIAKCFVPKTEFSSEMAKFQKVCIHLASVNQIVDAVGEAL